MPPPVPSSIERLAGDLARKLSAKISGQEQTLTYTLAVSGEAPVTNALNKALGDTLEAALNQTRQWQVDRTTDTKAPADYGLALQLKVNRGFIVGSAQLRRRPTTIWAQLRNPKGTLVAAVTGEVGLDRTARILLSQPLETSGLRRSKLRRIALPKEVIRDLKSPILDVWVGRLGSEPAPSMFILFRDQLLRLAWAPDRATQLRSRFDLSGLTPNPERVRQPLGRLLVAVHRDGTRSILAAVSDYAHPVALRATNDSLVRDARVAMDRLGWPLYQIRSEEIITAPWPRQRDVLTGTARSQRLDAKLSSPLAPLLPLHDLRGFSHRLGLKQHAAFLIASLPGGSMSLRHPKGIVNLGRHGMGAVIGDIDMDGEPELLVTGAGLSTERDVLTAYAITPDGRKRKLRRFNIRGMVTALATGDANDDARPEYWLATWTNRRPVLLTLDISRHGKP